MCLLILVKKKPNKLNLVGQVIKKLFFERLKPPKIFEEHSYMFDVMC
jgi:hypothetical protein